MEYNFLRHSVIFCSLVLTGMAQAGTVNIYWNQTFQSISGFGASCHWLADLTDAQADMYFSTTNGAGLSLLRARVPTDGSLECGVNMQKAVARGARVWANSYSPPASMKTNNSTINGGSLLPSAYQTYANYLTNYVKNVKAQYGINLIALSVQNEPDIAAPYDTAIWTGQNFHDFILNNLGPTFASNSITTKIVAAEQTWWNFDLLNETFADPAAAAYVGIAAAHDYSFAQASPFPLAQNMGKELWQTEVSEYIPENPPPFNPSIEDALPWAKRISDWMTIANANAWHHWLLHTAWSTDNQGLADSNLNPAKRLWVLGNFARFVRPGFVRIGATSDPDLGISISAFKDPVTGKFALVAVNQNPVGYTLVVSADKTLTSLTPYTTSASLNLQAGSSIAVANGQFTAILPAKSVTTFSGSSAEASLPASPSSLTATTASASQINLTWIDNSNNESGFSIQRSVDGVQFSQVASLGANISNYTDNGLASSSQYFYRVIASNSVGSSTSNTASAQTQAPSSSNYQSNAYFSIRSISGVPASVMAGTTLNLSTVLRGNQAMTNIIVDLEIIDPSGKKIKQTFFSGQSFSMGQERSYSMSYTLPNNSPAGLYTFVIAAFNSDWSVYYLWDNIDARFNVTASTGLTAAPSGLTAVAISSSQIKLTWIDNSTNESGFRVQRSNDGVNFSTIATLGAGATSYTSTGLRSARKYYYRVNASSAGGNSAYSNITSATTK